MLGITAIGIWVSDLIWTIIGTADMNQHQPVAGSGRFSIGTPVASATATAVPGGGEPELAEH